MIVFGFKKPTVHQKRKAVILKNDITKFSVRMYLFYVTTIERYFLLNVQKKYLFTLMADREHLDTLN